MSCVLSVLSPDWLGEERGRPPARLEALLPSAPAELFEQQRELQRFYAEWEDEDETAAEAAAAAGGRRNTEATEAGAYSFTAWRNGPGGVSAEDRRTALARAVSPARKACSQRRAHRCCRKESRSHGRRLPKLTKTLLSPHERFFSSLVFATVATALCQLGKP